MVYPDFQRPGTRRQTTAKLDTSLEERVKKTMQDVEKINREENHDRLNVQPTDEKKFERLIKMVYPDFQQPGTSRQAAAAAKRETSLEERTKKTTQDTEKIKREENHDRLKVKPTDEEKFEAWLLTGGEKSRFNPQMVYPDFQPPGTSRQAAAAAAAKRDTSLKERVKKATQDIEKIKREKNETSSISSASATTTMSQQSTNKSKVSILDLDMTKFMAKQAATIGFIDNMYTQEDSIFEQLKSIGVLKPPPSESSESPGSTSMCEINESLGKIFDREKQKGKASGSKSGKKHTKKESKKQKKAPEKKVNKVVERLLLPTHSSSAKQREKWVNVDADKDNKFMNMYEPETRRQIIKSIIHKHHHHQHPKNCVCSRHAEKFPDFKP